MQTGSRHAAIWNCKSSFVTVRKSPNGAGQTHKSTGQALRFLPVNVAWSFGFQRWTAKESRARRVLPPAPATFKFLVTSRTHNQTAGSPKKGTGNQRRQEGGCIRKQTSLSGQMWPVLPPSPGVACSDFLPDASAVVARQSSDACFGPKRCAPIAAALQGPAAPRGAHRRACCQNRELPQVHPSVVIPTLVSHGRRLHGVLPRTEAGCPGSFSALPVSRSVLSSTLKTCRLLSEKLPT